MIEQVGIAIFGCSAIFLVGCKGRIRRYGFLFGLLGQPFWFYSAWKAEQWGIFVLAFWYTFSWANGLKNNWKGE